MLQEIRLVLKSDLESNAKLVCVAFTDIADDNGGNLYPSLDNLAWKTGLSLRTVARAMTTLYRLGVVERIRQGGHRGTDGALTNHYQLHLDRLPRRPAWGASERARPAKVAAEVLPEWQQAPANMAEGAPAILAEGNMKLLPDWQKAPASLADDPTADPRAIKASALCVDQAGHSLTDQPAMPVATDTGIDKGMDREQDTGIEVSREKGVQPVAPVSPYQANSAYRAIRALSAEQFNRYQKMRMYIRIDHVPPEDLEAAVSHFITGGRDFEQAWGHFQELLARGNDKGRLLLARLRAGYSHPMTPDEREQARAARLAAIDARAAQRQLSAI